jgi:hypothetical protein
VPLGPQAEDGLNDARYPLKEPPEENCMQRTECNVRDSNCTTVYSIGDVSARA